MQPKNAAYDADTEKGGFHLGKLLEMQFDDDREKFIAAIEYGDHADSLQDIINLAQNLDCYWLYPSVHSEEEYGHYLVDELEEPELSDEVKRYFMYEEYGRDASINDDGMFTEKGYICNAFIAAPKALKSYFGTGLFAIVIHPITFYCSLFFLDMPTLFYQLAKIIHNQAFAIIRLSACNYILIQFEERTGEYMEYMSAPQAAEKWGISERRVQILCSEKRIPGVSKLGYMWLIHKDAEKPIDGRTKQGKELRHE